MTTTLTHHDMLDGTTKIVTMNDYQDVTYMAVIESPFLEALQKCKALGYDDIATLLQQAML